MFDPFDLSQLRRRRDDFRSAADRGPNLAAPSESMLVTITSGGHMPNTVPAVFLGYPTTVGGKPEGEGQTPTLQGLKPAIPVIVLGPKVPAIGDRLRAHRIDGFWVAQKGVYSPPSCSGTSACFTVWACDGLNGPGLVGAVITVRDSLGAIVPYRPGVDTCAEGAAGGGCCWSNLTDGQAYNVTVEPPASLASLYDSGGGPITPACGNNSYKFLLNPKSGYHCCFDCGKPIRDTLTVDWGFGTTPLTAQGPIVTGGGSGLKQVWSGMAMVPTTCDVANPVPDPVHQCCTIIGRPPCPVYFTFTCVNQQIFWLNVASPCFGPPCVPHACVWFWPDCCSQLGQYMTNIRTQGAVFQAAITDPGVSCSPLNVPFQTAGGATLFTPGWGCTLNTNVISVYQ